MSVCLCIYSLPNVNKMQIKCIRYVYKQINTSTHTIRWSCAFLYISLYHLHHPSVCALHSLSIYSLQISFFRCSNIFVSFRFLSMSCFSSIILYNLLYIYVFDENSDKAHAREFAYLCVHISMRIFISKKFFIHSSIEHGTSVCEWVYLKSWTM